MVVVVAGYPNEMSRFEKTIEKQAARLAKLNQFERQNIMTITAENII